MALITEFHTVRVSDRLYALSNAISVAENTVNDITEFLLDASEDVSTYDLGTEQGKLYSKLYNKRYELERFIEINKTKIRNLLDFYPDPDMILIKYYIKSKNINK